MLLRHKTVLLTVCCCFNSMFTSVCWHHKVEFWGNSPDGFTQRRREKTAEDSEKRGPRQQLLSTRSQSTWVLCETLLASASAVMSPWTNCRFQYAKLVKFKRVTGLKTSDSIVDPGEDNAHAQNSVRLRNPSELKNFGSPVPVYYYCKYLYIIFRWQEAVGYVFAILYIIKYLQFQLKTLMNMFFTFKFSFLNEIK